MSTDVGPSPATNAEELRDQVARRIATELYGASVPCKHAKVTSLSHAFRIPGAHSEISEMVHALREHRIEVSSGRPHISRRDVLELTLESCHEPAPSDLSPSMGVSWSVWSPGEAGREERVLTRDAVLDRSTDSVLWFDVAPISGDLSSVEAHDRIDEITDLLRRHCPQLDDLVVRDLLTPDAQPKVETYGDERTGVRSISVAAAIAREVPDADDEFDGLDEMLLFQTVEMITGPGWIVTCWHPSLTFSGNEEGECGPVLLREPFLSHVAHRWVHDRAEGPDPETAKTSSDLGLYLARSLVATYGASIRMLQRWVSSWEVDFYKSLRHQDKPKKLKGAAGEISNFLSLVGEFHRAVSAFRLAGEEMPNKSWFADPVAESLGQSAVEHAKPLMFAVETAERKLAQLATDIRADMDLLMIQSQAAQQETSERLQNYLGKVTGLVLVPSFVAGLFGANTALPGGGSWAGFDLMMLLMVASSAISYFVIRKLLT